MTIRDIGILLGFKVDQASEKAAENTITSLKSMANRVLGAIGISFSLVKMNAIIEEFGAVNNGIKAITGSLEEAEAAQQGILDAANACHQSYSSMASTVKGLTQSANNLFDIDTATSYASTITKLLKTSGSSDSTISSVLNSLNSSFKTGKVSGGTISTLIQSAPEAAKILANYLGTTQKRLTTMASNGRIRVQDLKNAFLNAADEIDEAYAEMDVTITDALKNIRNNWGFWLTDMNKTLGITNTIARALLKLSDILMAFGDKVKKLMEWLADKVGGMDNLLKLIGVTAAAIFVKLKAEKINKFLTGVLASLSKINLQTLAFIAKIVAIGLIIDDLIAFAKGDNSLFGELLKGAGIDVDEFRDTCKVLWEQVLDIIDVVKDLAKELGAAFLEGLKDVLSLGMSLAEAVLPVVLDLLNAIVPLLLDVIEKILPPMVDFISAVFDVLEPVFDIVVQLVDTLLPPLMTLLESIAPILEPILSLLQPIAEIIGTIVDGVAKVIGWAGEGLSWLSDKLFGDTDVNNAVKTVLTGTIAGPQAVEALTGSSSVNKSVVQNVEINNTFNGDREGQQKSEAAMSSASDDAVGAMARAMAYAR